MARTKAQEQKAPNQEAASDVATTDESTAQPSEATEQPGDETTADTEAESAGAGADPTPSAPPDDEPGDKPAVDREVLILRDETVGDVDFKPGDTPMLAAADVDYLIARGAADDNPKAVDAARKARWPDAKAERVIE